MASGTKRSAARMRYPPPPAPLSFQRGEAAVGADLIVDGPVGHVGNMATCASNDAVNARPNAAASMRGWLPACVGRLGKGARAAGRHPRIGQHAELGGPRTERHQVQAPLQPGQDFLVLDRLDRVGPVGAVVLEPVQAGVHDAMASWDPATSFVPGGSRN